jgi:hypothetical protein
MTLLPKPGFSVAFPTSGSAVMGGRKVWLTGLLTNERLRWRERRAQAGKIMPQTGGPALRDPRGAAWVICCRGERSGVARVPVLYTVL